MADYKLAARENHPSDTVIEVKKRKIGGGSFAVIAGPCSVETEEQMLSDALKQKCDCRVLVRKIGPTLAIHVGEGSLGVAWL